MWNMFGQITFTVAAIIGLATRDSAMLYGGLACALGCQIMAKLEAMES